MNGVVEVNLQNFRQYLDVETDRILSIALGEALRVRRPWIGLEFLLIALSRVDVGRLNLRDSEEAREFRGRLRALSAPKVAPSGGNIVEEIIQLAEPYMARLVDATIGWPEDDRQPVIVTPRLWRIFCSAIMSALDAGYTHISLDGLWQAVYEELNQQPQLAVLLSVKSVIVKPRVVENGTAVSTVTLNGPNDGQHISLAAGGNTLLGQNGAYPGPDWSGSGARVVIRTRQIGDCLRAELDSPYGEVVHLRWTETTVERRGLSEPLTSESLLLLGRVAAYGFDGLRDALDIDFLSESHALSGVGVGPPESHNDLLQDAYSEFNTNPATPSEKATARNTASYDNQMPDDAKPPRRRPINGVTES